MIAPKLLRMNVDDVEVYVVHFDESIHCETVSKARLTYENGSEYVITYTSGIRTGERWYLGDSMLITKQRARELESQGMQDTRAQNIFLKAKDAYATAVTRLKAQRELRLKSLEIINRQLTAMGYDS